ncbi:MAG: amidohydrolase [Lachnospiraceae bacterium]|jgi:predicted amidohydrolase YtcJ
MNKTIYYNGKVYTGTLPLVTGFVTEGGRIIAAGSDEEVRAAAPGADAVDLGGRFVMAAFNDSHMHLLSYGNSLRQARLDEHTKSLADMIRYLQDFLWEHPRKNGAWLLGRGWNQDYFTDVKRMPTRSDLDRVSADIPICVTRACGHILCVNSKAISLMGVTDDTKSPEGGAIGHDENGHLNGIFSDNAMDEYVYPKIPVPDKDEIKEMIGAACRELNRFGVTSSQTDDYCMFRAVPWQTVNEAYKELEEEGQLTVRVYEQSNFTSLDDLKEFYAQGCTTGAGTDNFKIGPLKMLGDGALGARTAYLSRPYADDPSTCGYPLFDQETFDAMIGFANEHGMQVAVHAIGDACLDMVLNAYAKAFAAHPRRDHRCGIVHCQVTRPEQLKRIADMNLHVYMQSIFLNYDIHMIHERVGDELASTSYAWKTLQKNGVSVSNGTDCPVELPDALACMQCGVTRRTLDGTMGPYLPQEAFSVQEILDSYTIRSAEASFEENVKGRIAPGYMADFVVLGENPFEVPADRLKDIPVLATFMKGRKVYGQI